MVTDRQKACCKLARCRLLAEFFSNTDQQEMPVMEMQRGEGSTGSVEKQCLDVLCLVRVLLPSLTFPTISAEILDVFQRSITSELVTKTGRGASF